MCKKKSLGKLYACQTLVSKGFGSPYFLCFDLITYSRFSKKNKCEMQKFDFLRNFRWDFSESVAVNPSVVGDCLKMFVGKKFKLLDHFYVRFKRFLIPLILCFVFITYARFSGENKCETQKINHLQNVGWDFDEIKAVHPWVRGDTVIWLFTGYEVKIFSNDI